jgi:predicted nucleic-acid-binding Zn-ribbon protein
MSTTACPACGRDNRYESEISVSAAYAAAILPGLGLFSPATFTVVVCADCGLTQLFTGEQERKKITESGDWARLPHSSS